MTRRAVIAAAWLAGGTVPLLLAALFIFGCCVLPFHSVAHQLMPVCHAAAALLNGSSDSDDPTPAVPRQSDQRSAKHVTLVPTRFELAADRAATARDADLTPARRSLISLGALRCDQDVGIYLLDSTFLI